MTKEQALNLWEQLFEGQDVAFDYASHEIHKEDYLDNTNGFGWDVEFKQPLYAGGNSSNLNMTISAILTKSIRNGKASFKIGNFKYQVRKGKKYGSFEIFDISNPNNPISMEPNELNQDPVYNLERKRNALEMAREQTNNSTNDFLSKFLKNKLQETTPIIKENPVKKDTLSLKEEVKKETAEVQEEVKTDTVEDLNTAESDVKDKEEIVVTIDGDNKEEEIINEDNGLVEEESVIEEDTDSTEVIENNETSEAIEENNPTWINDNEKFEYTRPQETVAEKELVENAEPIVAITFNDNEAKFVKTEPFEKEEWKTVNGKESAVESVSDANFVLNATEVKEGIVEETTPELDTLEKTTTTEFKTTTEENKVEDNSISFNVQEEIENKEEKVVEEVIEDKIEEETLTKSFEEVKDDSELSKYIDVDDDETIIIDNNSIEPDKDTDIGGLLKKIDDLKKLVYSLESEQDKTKEKMRSLSEAFESEKQTNNSFHLDNTQLNDKINNLSNEKTKLEEEIDSLKQDIEEKEKENNRISSDLVSTKAKLEEFTNSNSVKDTTIISLQEIKKQQDTKYSEMTQKLSEVSLSLADSQNKNKDLEFENRKKDEKIQGLEEQKNNLNNDKTNLQNTLSEKESTISNLNSKIDNYKNDIDILKSDELFSSVGIDNKYYDDCRNYLNTEGLDLNYDNVLLALSNNPNWERNYFSNVIYHPVEDKEDEETLEDMTMTSSLVEDIDVSYLTKEIKRKQTAIDLFKAKYGADMESAIDFAGREIRIDDYLNEKSKYGWDYVTLDSSKLDTKDNVIIASLRSLQDYNANDEFSTNGHRFKVVEKDDIKFLDSKEFITDIYDYNQAMTVVEQESDKPVPLVYMFIKFTGIKAEVFDSENQKKFNDLIARTVKRCCPNSYLQLQTIKDYTFIVFDASIDGAYREIYRYVILLNSYRTEFKKRQLLNAIIVLDKLMAPISFRHLTFEQLLNETNDVDLKAIKYAINNVPVVDSLIKRAVHIGPQIVSDLPVDVAQLVVSRIGVGNFAVIYKFEGHFYELPYIYKITKK